MKLRRHHNNKGHRQIRRGKTRDQVKRMAKRLGVPFGRRAQLPHQIAQDQRDESGTSQPFVRGKWRNTGKVL